MSEVAAVLRIPIATLRYWRHLGTGPRSFRMGRSVRYWRTDVFAWLDDDAQRALTRGRRSGATMNSPPDREI